MRAQVLWLALLIAPIAIASLVVPSLGAVIWDEGGDGDLSGNMAAPTSLALSEGSNTLTATSVSGDREYVHLSLASPLQLTAIVLQSYSGADGTAFIAIQAGSVFTEPPTGTVVGNLLGYSHFGPGPGNVGQNILPAMGIAFGAIGFTPPLTGPDYTLWMQQTGANASTYTFDFQTVPEPGTLCLLGIGGLMLLVPAMARARRKR